MRSTLTLPVLLLPFLAAAQWTPLGTGMLSDRSMTYHNGDLFCATYPNGVRKQTNGAGSWDLVNNGLPSSGGNYFVESVGADGSYVYAGTESGIYRSNDQGANWTAANGALTANSNVYANKFLASGNSILAVFAGAIADGGGIWRSNDHGSTWLIGHSGMGSNAVVYQVTPVGSTLWASTSTGLWTSTDNAQNWNPVTSANYAVYGLASQGSTLVIVSTFGIRYSTNGGSSWMDATGDVNSPTRGEIVAFDGTFYALLPSPTGCLRSLDQGATWSDYNTGFSQIDAAAQEEFFVHDDMLYCTALFDIYSITGSGLGLQEVPASGMSLRPTCFHEGFLFDAAGRTGRLELVDAAGRVALQEVVPAGGTHWCDRGGIAPGVYRARLIDHAGPVIDLGPVVAD